MQFTCKLTLSPALADPDKTDWSFCPNIGAAYLFAVIFGLTTIAHIAQSVIHRKFYCWVIAMSGLWQTANYVFRILSIKNPNTDSWYEYWFVLMLVSSLKPLSSRLRLPVGAG